MTCLPASPFLANWLCIESNSRPFVVGAALAGDALGMKHRLAGRTGRPGGIEAVVLVDGHLELGRHVASPPVVTGDPVRIGRADISRAGCGRRGIRRRSALRIAPARNCAASPAAVRRRALRAPAAPAPAAPVIALLGCGIAATGPAGPSSAPAPAPTRRPRRRHHETHDQHPDDTSPTIAPAEQNCISPLAQGAGGRRQHVADGADAPSAAAADHDERRPHVPGLRRLASRRSRTRRRRSPRRPQETSRS